MTNIIQRIQNIRRNHGLKGVASAIRDHIRHQYFKTIRRSLYRYSGMDRLCHQRAVSHLRQLQDQEETLDDVFETAYEFSSCGNYSSIRPMQERHQLRRLIELVSSHHPETVVEIGTARGGTFYILSRGVDSVTDLVSLDLGHGGGYRYKIDLFEQFSDKRTSFIVGDSHVEENAEKIERIMDDGVDFLFIDGDHSYEGVKQDFETYRELVNDGGLIAFHDIVHEHPRVGVDEFWSEVTAEYETTEIMKSPDQETGGIGVIHWKRSNT